MCNIYSHFIDNIFKNDFFRLHHFAISCNFHKSAGFILKNFELKK